MISLAVFLRLVLEEIFKLFKWSGPSNVYSNVYVVSRFEF